MSVLHTLNLVVLLACLAGTVGCGKDTTPAEISAAPTNPSVVVPSDTAPINNTSNTNSGNDNSSPTTPANNTVSITYYQVTKTIAPNASFPAKTYTATGYCTDYLGEKYCWDDGKKTVVISGFSFYYSYFNMSKNAVGYSHSSGGMQSDLMVAPTIIVSGGGLEQNMAAGAESEVFNTGSATTIDCTEASGVVTCPAFTIDSNQTPI